MMIRKICDRIVAHRSSQKDGAAFTLIETLVAISLLSVAIVAPMSLTTQSLMGAYYARDQVTAFFLAQEAIEGVRSVRDGNILTTALGTPTDIMTGIPTNGLPFTVDVVHMINNNQPTLTTCPNTGCPPLQTDGELYGYNFTPAGADTNFIRSVTACYIQSNGTCSGVTPTDEIKVSVTVTWQTAAYKQNTFTLTANLYRWIYDTTAVTTVAPPTASLTANGLTNVTVSAGDTVTYVWSSTGATSWAGSYTTDSPACGAPSTGPFDWNSAGLSLNGTRSGVIQACQAGHTYTLTYTVTAADGQTASAPVTVIVNP